MIKTLRSMKWSLSFLLCVGRERACHELGLLPPPRDPRLAGVRARIEWWKSGKPDFHWGRGGEGGGSRFSICGHPLPCPSPASGEGMLWRCLRATITTCVLVSLGCSAAAQAPAPQQRVTIGYVDIAGDPRHEPIKAYERIVL